MADEETTITMRCPKSKKRIFQKAQKLMGINDLSSFMLMAATEKTEAEYAKRGLPNPFLDLPKQEVDNTNGNPIPSPGGVPPDSRSQHSSGKHTGKK